MYSSTRWTRGLIELLAEEPRIGVLECSRRLGVARGTVQARLDKLVDRGVIGGFGPEISPGRDRLRGDQLRHPGDQPAARPRPGHRPPGRDPRGAGGAHHHRLQRPALPDRGPLQRRPAAGDRPDRLVRGHPPGLDDHRAGRADPVPHAAAGPQRARRRNSRAHETHRRHGRHRASTATDRAIVRYACRAVANGERAPCGGSWLRGAAARLVTVVVLAATGVWNPFPGVWDWVDRSEPISEPDVVWQQRIGGTPRSVTIAGDAVVVEQRTRVEARSLATGVQLWERKADWSAVAGGDRDAGRRRGQAPGQGVRGARPDAPARPGGATTTRWPSGRTATCCWTPAASAPPTAR